HPWPADEQNAYRLADWIRSKDPARPSSVADDVDVQNSLRGDLDAIILKALRKPPEDRYHSVGALSEDLKRHLDGLPVAAREATWAYVSLRFARRHRVVLSLVSALVVMALLFGTVSTVLWQRAERSRAETAAALREAEAERLAKHGAIKFVTEVLEKASPEIDDGSSPENLFEVVKNVEDTLDDQEPLIQAELLAVVGSVYSAWGYFDSAKNAYLRAEEIARRLQPPNIRVLAKAVNNVASSDFGTGNYISAVEGYEQALALKEQLPHHLQIDSDIGKTMSNLANAKMRAGLLDGVEELHRRALSFRELNPSEQDQGIASSLRGLGVAYHELGQLDKAEASMSKALELYRSLGPDFASRTASTVNGLGRLAHDRQDFERAERFYLEALDILQQLYEGQPHMHLAASSLDFARLHLDRSDTMKAGQQLDSVELWLAGQPPQHHATLRIRYLSLRGQFLLQSENEEGLRLLEAACTMAHEEGQLGIHGQRACNRLRGPASAEPSQP
ncbi:MAG: tetratricopeptide repeat protein, partial [Planctomycetota bacterium]